MSTDARSEPVVVVVSNDIVPLTHHDRFGGTSVERLALDPPEPVHREAAFHSIQGQTPLVKAETINRLASPSIRQEAI